jgi:anti-sigma B factor antagonist
MTAPGVATEVSPDPADLHLRTVVEPGGCTVTVTGEVDARCAPVLERGLLEVLTRPDVAVVELDLSRVAFLGAAGLTTLVVAHRAAERTGRLLRMRCGTNRAVRRPLELTGLSSVFALVDGP